MEDTQQVILDARMSHIIRSYKQNDNLFYAYGVDNIVFGMLKTDSFSYESFQSIMPIGVSINGVIAVYNENTYEDFEGVLAEEIETTTFLSWSRNVPKAEPISLSKISLYSSVLSAIATKAMTYGSSLTTMYFTVPT